MLNLKRTTFIILLFCIVSPPFVYAQVEICDNCYIWEFTTNDGDRDQTTRLLSNDIEDILSQYSECKVLQRSRYAKLLEQINNEKAIHSLGTTPAQIKAELRTIKAKRVIFGSVNRDFQGNVSLRLSFENLETSQVKSNTAFLINEDYYNFDKRKKKLTEFVKSFIDPDGKVVTQPGSVDPEAFQEKIEDGQWELVLEGCKRSGDNVSLFLKITSKREERELRIIGFGRGPGTKIIDDKGRTYSPTRLQIANNIQGGHSISQEFVSDLPTEVVFTFSEIPNDAKMIMLFQINFDNENQVFKFRKIPIKN